MAEVLETLEKILKLEEEKGYANTAVMGGLGRFFARLVSDTERIGNGSQLARGLQELSSTFSEYASLSPDGRRERVSFAQDWLITARSGRVSVASPTTPKDKAGTLKQKPAMAKPDHKAVPVQKSSPAKSKTGGPKPGGLTLDSPAGYLKMVSTPVSARLTKLGVDTVRDLLYLYPRRYIDRSNLKRISQLIVGEEETVSVTVWQASAKMIGRDKPSTEAIVGDDSGNIRVLWFNQSYLAKQLTPGAALIISGKVSLYQGFKVFMSPEYELLTTDDLVHTGRLVPVYPLTQGLSMRTLRRVVKYVVDQYSNSLIDPIPDAVKDGADLINLGEAIRQIHFPESWEAAEVARNRLAFDEFFYMQLAALARRHSWQDEQKGNALNIDRPKIDRFIEHLPFDLTKAQMRVIDETLADLQKDKPMSRLLQGDVGSGKTVVAAIGLLAACNSGYQSVLMAPTEILAEQHFRSLTQMFAGRSSSDEESGQPHEIVRMPSVCLLTGSQRKSEKAKLYKGIADGSIDVVVGTHALIQEGVDFHNLGVAVVDEQHRFGVAQRSALRQKGYNPHMLVMSATPIPRTLALTLYGDLDLSVIDEMPPGRQKISTKYLPPSQRQRAYDFINEQILEGRQAFVICPLIEESDKIEAKAAVAEYERLSLDVFPGLKVGLLHGKMRPAEKDEVMRSFRDREIDILVSTSVIEVGIDIPNASVMLIEGADRFGLSQLHQFRGRVGRGSHRSYCLLLSSSSSTEPRERLAVMEKTEDGFELAEHDLRLRGPGEFFGTRQSGLPELRIANLSDTKILESARIEAFKLFAHDPELSKPEHSAIRLRLSTMTREGGDLS